MRELMKQRDLAHSRLGDLLRVVGDDQPLGHRVLCFSIPQCDTLIHKKLLLLT